jgi:hypothetical protein
MSRAGAKKKSKTHLRENSKEHVLTYVDELITDGYAERNALRNGNIEIRFRSGEIFLLAERFVRRIA